MWCYSRSTEMRISATPLFIVTATCIFVLISPAVAAKSSARPTSIVLPINNNKSFRLPRIDKLRGGSAYEQNPNYKHQHSPTLGDVDEDGYYRAATATFQSPMQSNNQRPSQLLRAITNYFTNLHAYSPTLFNGTMSSILLFLLWQFPTSSVVSTTLRNHFVTSSYNLRKGRYHALILSAFSHADLRHLVLNMYAFSTFGRSVKALLASQGVGLWPFVISSAIAGNLVFLLLDKGTGSCIGLSGVTLALLAFDSLVYPTKELRLFVSFFPITLPAYYLFIGLLGFSVLGIFGFAGRESVAHSTHLGGLVYGAMCYEAFKRGWLRLWSYRLRKASNAMRGG